MDKKSMLEAMINHYTNGNKAKFAILLGVSAQTISAWGARNTFDSELIYTKCRYLSPDWLLTGEGSMLRNSKNPEETNLCSTPIATPVSPAEESVIYKMYKDKDGENKALFEELGSLKERLRSMEQELSAFKSHSQFQNKESDHQSRISEVMEAFTLESSGISGEDFLPTKPPTSKRLSAGKM